MRCCAPLLPAWRSSRRIAGTVILPQISIRSAPSRSATPSLEPQTYGLTPALQSAIPAGVLRVKVPGNTLAEVLPHLKETYSSTIAYEIEHISNANQRVWLRDYIESGRNKIKQSPQRQIEFLERLTQVEAFDRYVRKTFLGQKTFSGEGLDVMVPMLEEMLDMLADDGVGDCGSRYGASRTPQRDRARRQPSVRRSHDRVRSGAVPRQSRRRRRDGRRQVPSRRDRNVYDLEGKGDQGHAGSQSEPPGSGRSGRRRQRARVADRSLAWPALPRSQARGPDSHSRRRRLYRSGHRLGSLQHAVAAGLRNRRHDSSHREQSNRLHDRSVRCALDALRFGLGEGLRRSDRARQRRRRRRVHRGRAPGHRFSPRVRPRRAHRSHRLSALRPQRAGRTGLHAAADGRTDQEPSDRARALREQARESRSSHGGAARSDGRRSDGASPSRRAVPSKARWHRTFTGRKLSGSNTFDGTVLPSVDRAHARRMERGADRGAARLHAQPKASHSIRAAQRHDRRERRRRLGNGGIARLRIAADDRHADSPDRSRYRARHV